VPLLREGALIGVLVVRFNQFSGLTGTGGSGRGARGNSRPYREQCSLLHCTA
jgi:hypothetical protein